MIELIPSCVSRMLSNYVSYIPGPRKENAVIITTIMWKVTDSDVKH